MSESDSNRFEHTWRGDVGHFEMTISGDLLGITRFYGKGTMDGTRAFIAALDEGRDAVADAGMVRALIDLRQLEGVPLRAQLMLGKWLRSNKDRFNAIAVFGGKPWEMKFVKAVTKIAGFTNVGFYEGEKGAMDFLSRYSS